MARNYLYNLLLTLANILFPTLSFPYAAHAIGPDGIGKAQFVLSFAQYFALFAAFGIPTYGLTQVARNRESRGERSVVFSELIIIYFVSSVLLTAVYSGVVTVLPFFAADRGLYLAGALFIFLSFSSIDWLYSGLEEFKIIALRSILIKIVALVLLFIFVDGPEDYHHYLYIMMFSYLGNNVLSLLLAGGKVKLLFRGLDFRRHLKPLWFIFATTLAGSMYTLMDTVLLGFLSDERAVGLYTAAVKLVKIALPLVTSMGVILIPGISKAFAAHNLAEAQVLVDKTFRFVAFFAIPVTTGLLLLAPEFILVFSGQEFLPAVAAMRILSVLPLLIGLGHLFLLLILVPAGKNIEMLYSVLGGMVTGLVLNFLLVPQMRELGAAVANVVSELVVTGLYFYFINRSFSFRLEWGQLGRSVIAALVFIPVVFLVRSLGVNVYISLTLSVSGCALAYFGVQGLVFKSEFIADAFLFVRTKLGKVNQVAER